MKHRLAMPCVCVVAIYFSCVRRIYVSSWMSHVEVLGLVERECCVSSRVFCPVQSVSLLSFRLYYLFDFVFHLYLPLMLYCLNIRMLSETILYG